MVVSSVEVRFNRKLFSWLSEIMFKGSVTMLMRLFVRWFQSLLLDGRGLILPLSFLLAGILFQNLSSLTPWLIESIYARAFYPRLLGALSILSRRVGFSLGEIITTLGLVITGLSILFFCIGVVRRRGGRRLWVFEWLRYAAWVVAGILWFFLFTFGLNYNRPLLFELLGYEQRQAAPQELEALGRVLVENVNHAYVEAHPGHNTAPEREEIVNLLNESYATVPAFELLPRGEFAPPKPVFSSEVLTRLGISGIYFPFTAEPNYNADIPDFQLPFSIAHEMAHQRGIARESEANFVAYVVCINSRDPFVRYSGYRNGLGVLSELYKVEPEKARELAKQLGTGYREDSRRAELFWAKARGVAGALSYRMNDLYLRANRVKAGAADYSNSTTLIIAYHLQQRPAGAIEVPR
jgi:hypothetical protein